MNYTICTACCRQQCNLPVFLSFQPFTCKTTHQQLHTCYENISILYVSLIQFQAKFQQLPYLMQPLNRCHPRIVTTLEQSPPSNSRHPRIVATQSEALKEINTTFEQQLQLAYAAHTHANNSIWSSTRAVCVVQLFSTAESRTVRLCILLTASNSRHWITRTYFILPSLVSAGLSKEINATLEQQPHKNEQQKNENSV